MTKESTIEWASHWVPDQPTGQRQRFAECLALELNGWAQRLQSVNDLAAARLRNGPLDPNVEHDLKQIVALSAEILGSQ